MTNRIETYTHLQSSVISADLPPYFHCEKICERLRLVAKNDACVGGLEIVTIEDMLEKTSLEVKERKECINVYHDVDGRKNDECLILKFINFGQNIGHFEQIVVSDIGNSVTPKVNDDLKMSAMDESEEQNIEISKIVRANDIIPVPRKSPVTEIRKRFQVPSLDS